MEITNIFLVFVTLTLSVQVLNAEETNVRTNEAAKPSFNPLEDLILNQNQNGIKDKPYSRVKRQYGYYPGYYPVPIILPLGGFGGFGGFGGGFGRGFGGRGFGGRGFGGRGGGFGGGRGGRG